MARAWNYRSKTIEEKTRQAFNPIAYRIHPDGSRSAIVQPEPDTGWLSYPKRRKDDQAWLAWREKHTTGGAR